MVEDNFASAEEDALLPRPFVFATFNDEVVFEDVKLVEFFDGGKGEGMRDLLAGAGDGMRDLEEAVVEDEPDAVNLPPAVVG